MYKIDDKTKAIIEHILSKGDRAELIPVKDKIRVLRVRRDIVKIEENPPKPEN